MLSQFLTSQIFAFLLIFCRLGSAMMLLPGFGEAYVAPRVRLMLALMFSLTLVPVVHNLPPLPATVTELFGIMIAEIAVGLFFGAITRMLIATVHMAGMIIAYQASLISALVPDIAQGQSQVTSLGNFLSMAVVVLLFTTDLHHLMLKSLADSYTLFLPGHFPLVEDFSTHAVQTMNGAFRMAMQMAAPYIVVGIILFLAMGIIARLMPNIQIFFIMVAPQLLLSFFIFMVTISSVLMWYMDYFKDSLSGFLAP
jgi:flagellar biosynthetic protein FliR